MKCCTPKKPACCGIGYKSIPAALGDDTGPFKPENGAYHNMLIRYEENGALYLYTNDGIFTQLDGERFFLMIEKWEHDTSEELEAEIDQRFSDLNVQSEIDHKLNEMVEDGTLQEIIEQYLQTNVAWTFDTVADMKAAENLVAGAYAETIGYHAKNDNGGGLYYITDEALTANEATIIAAGDLFAVLVTEENSVTAEQFGCYGDGTHDDTTALQACIDYAIANKKQIDFTGTYLVEPILQDDNTKVCLKVYRSSSYLGSDTGITFNFVRESKIFTDSNDECTLIRFNIGNINFENALLEGVSGKTTLIEFSKIDKLDTTEQQWTCYNIFRNLMLLDFKQAIHMEGNSYYNTFDKCTIRYGVDGIVLDFTALEKAGLAQNSNVNRNDFSNITIQNTTGKGIAIYYGDTNKFNNISFEGVADCVYLDDPQQHPGDFLIAPMWSTTQNMFTNVIAEVFTGGWINNSTALKIINTSIGYQEVKNTFTIPPQSYINGALGHSVEKVMDIWKSDEELPIANTQKYSTIINSNNGTISKNYSDFQVSSGTYKVLSRRNIPFDETRVTNLKTGTTISYETLYKCMTKQIGGIVFFYSKFSMQPEDLTANIELPLDSSITADNQLYAYNNIEPVGLPVLVSISGVPTVVRCNIRQQKLVLYPPQGGWSASITVSLNLNWLRDTLSF